MRSRTTTPLFLWGGPGALWGIQTIYIKLRFSPQLGLFRERARPVQPTHSQTPRLQISLQPSISDTTTQNAFHCHYCCRLGSCHHRICKSAIIANDHKVLNRTKPRVSDHRPRALLPPVPLLVLLLPSLTREYLATPLAAELPIDQSCP
jgi:hypothetical protein